MAIVDGFEAGIAAAGRGATMLQLRMPGQGARSLEAVACRLVEFAGLPVVVSSRVDVALACGAAGVNLPENDLPVAGARRLLGTSRLVGRSVHDLPGALAAAADGASFVLFGPVFDTPTHAGRPGTGLGVLAGVATALSIPVLAVGGVDGSRVQACLDAGASGHAAIRMYS